jgi:hypothetical protein
MLKQLTAFDNKVFLKDCFLILHSDREIEIYIREIL